MPLPGYDIVYPSNQLAEEYKALLKQDGLEGGLKSPVRYLFLITRILRSKCQYTTTSCALFILFIHPIWCREISTITSYLFIHSFIHLVFLFIYSFFFLFIWDSNLLRQKSSYYTLQRLFFTWQLSEDTIQAIQRQVGDLPVWWRHCLFGIERCRQIGKARTHATSARSVKVMLARTSN